jgi:transcriptional regulator with XRE-family HTH domain
MRKAKKKEVKSPLQAVFLRRLHDEMERQGLSGNALAQREGAPPQRTIADVLNGADPRLETVNGLAVALGVRPVDLLTQAKGIPEKVHQISPYPPILGRADNRERTFPADRRRRRA